MTKPHVVPSIGGNGYARRRTRKTAFRGAQHGSGIAMGGNKGGAKAKGGGKGGKAAAGSSASDNEPAKGKKGGGKGDMKVRRRTRPFYGRPTCARPAPSSLATD